MIDLSLMINDLGHIESGDEGAQQSHHGSHRAYGLRLGNHNQSSSSSFIVIIAIINITIVVVIIMFIVVIIIIIAVIKKCSLLTSVLVLVLLLPSFLPLIGMLSLQGWNL